MGFERVFLSVRPIVLSLARSTMFSSTTVSSSSRNVHRARPLGGLEQAKAISLASAAPSKIRGRAEAAECLRVRTAANPSCTSCWRVRLTVATLVFRAFEIWLSLHPSPPSEASAFNRMRAFMSCRAGCLPAWINLSSCSRSSSLSFTTYLFTAISLAATNRLRHCAAEPSIRKFHASSMTQGTSDVKLCPAGLSGAGGFHPDDPRGGGRGAHACATGGRPEGRYLPGLRGGERGR